MAFHHINTELQPQTPSGGNGIFSGWNMLCLHCDISELLSSTPRLFIATTGAVLQLNANSLELEACFSLQGITVVSAVNDFDILECFNVYVLQLISARRFTLS